MIGESREQRRRKRMEDEIACGEAHTVVPGSGAQAWLDRAAWQLCRQRAGGRWHWGGPLVLLASGCWVDLVSGVHGYLAADLVVTCLIALRAHTVHTRFLERSREASAGQPWHAE